MSDCIYIKSNSEWDLEEKLKYGYVYRKDGDENLINRICNSREEHSELSKFIGIYAFKKTVDYKLYNEIDKIFSYIASNLENIKIVEEELDISLPLLRKLNEHLVKSKTKQSNEFIYKSGIPLLQQILEKEFPLLGLKLVKTYKEDEIDEINNSCRKQARAKTKKRHDSLMDIFKRERNKKPKVIKGIQKEERKWFKRDYQEKAIKYGLEQLREFSKFYLELATGAGKSYIVYNILNQIRPDTIVIFSPRKGINKQNVSAKYLSLLNDEYQAYNCSTDRDFNTFQKNCKKLNKKMVIVATPQGANQKVYNIIHEYELTNVFIWFDEAHWAIENWTTKLNDSVIKFFLEDSEIIRNRIFTSASPNKDIVIDNPDIFGKHMCPIKVTELIALKWLCPIVPHILEYNISDFNLLNWILEGFNDKNKKFGFSFHSRDNNAFKLFYKHYELYKDSQTDIKPYVLIDITGLNSDNQRCLTHIKLEYNYRDVLNFENNDNIDSNPKHIAYVVDTYKMGYDFSKLDYIVISDPMCAHKAIIQSIGRGTRPDKKGPNGSNLHKQLDLMLPTYINNEDTSKYKNILEVLRYLVYDLDIDISDIFTNSSGISGNSKTRTYEEYAGTKSNRSIILDLLYANNILKKINTKTLIKFCKKYNITSETDYHTFRKANPSHNLKNNLYEYPGFNWKSIVDPTGEIYYNTKKECEKSKEKIIEKLQQTDTLPEDELVEILEDIEEDPRIVSREYDPKIPPYIDLDRYYI